MAKRPVPLDVRQVGSSAASGCGLGRSGLASQEWRLCIRRRPLELVQTKERAIVEGLRETGQMAEAALARFRGQYDGIARD